MGSCANLSPWHLIPLITAYFIWVEPSDILNNGTQHLKPAGLLKPQDNSHLKACLPQRTLGCRNVLSLQEQALFSFSTVSCKTYLLMPTLSHRFLEGNCSCTRFIPHCVSHLSSFSIQFVSVILVFNQDFNYFKFQDTSHQSKMWTCSCG